MSYNIYPTYLPSLRARRLCSIDKNLRVCLCIFILFFFFTFFFSFCVCLFVVFFFFFQSDHPIVSGRPRMTIRTRTAVETVETCFVRSKCFGSFRAKPPSTKFGKSRRRRSKCSLEKKLGYDSFVRLHIAAYRASNIYRKRGPERVGFGRI